MGRRSRFRQSIVSQVGHCFKKLDAIGKSKHKEKQGDVKNIKNMYEYNGMQKYLSDSKSFAKWVKENYGIKNLFQLTPEHHSKYIEHKKAEGVSDGRLENIESALRKLQQGMNELSQQRGKEPYIFFEKRLIKNKKKPQPRNYTKKEYQKIYQKLPTEAKKAAFLSFHIGLRPREACRVRKEHFDFKNGILYIPEKKAAKKLGVKSASGITKAGRYRVTPLKREIIPHLKKIVKEKNNKDRLVNLEPSTLRKYLSDVCKEIGIKNRGWHGLRHSYSVNEVEKVAEEKGYEVDQIRNIIQVSLTNYDQGERPDSDLKKEDYQKGVEVVNEVMDRIGHGEGRWQLIRTYCASLL